MNLHKQLQISWEKSPRVYNLSPCVSLLSLPLILLLVLFYDLQLPTLSFPNKCRKPKKILSMNQTLPLSSIFKSISFLRDSSRWKIDIRVSVGHSFNVYLHKKFCLSHERLKVLVVRKRVLVNVWQLKFTNTLLTETLKRNFIGNRKNYRKRLRNIVQNRLINTVHFTIWVERIHS